MSTTDDDVDRYAIGYGKPPVKHRFQKGQSGNPKGSKRKPRGRRHSKDLKTELFAELGQRVAVTENGRPRRMARQKALIKKLVADALGGDPRAREQLIKLANQAEASPETAHDEDLIGAAKDAEILDRFRAEIIEEYERSKR
jgi:hypothetical protein